MGDLRYIKKTNRYLDQFVEEVLTYERDHSATDLPTKVTRDFHDSHFTEKVAHPHLHDVPLISQKTRQKSIWPTHTSEKRKLIIDICRQLKANDGGMVKLRLANYEIDDALLKQISDKLVNNTFLQFLILHNNFVTDNGLKQLCMSLRRHPAVHTLYLGSNRITDEGIRHLSDLLVINHHLKDVIFSNKWPSTRWTDSVHSIHPHITHIGAEYLAEQLKAGCSLTSISLAHQRVRDAGAIALFDALPSSGLRTLNLEANELTDACRVEFMRCLEANPCLEKLVVSHNEFSDITAVVVGKALAKNSSLKVLDLSYNAIDSSGMNSLYFGVSMSTTMWSIITIGNKTVDNRFEDIFMRRQPAQDFSSDLKDAPYAVMEHPIPWEQSKGPVKLPPVANVGFHGRMPVVVDKLTIENLEAHNKRNTKRDKSSRGDDASSKTGETRSIASRRSSRPGSAGHLKSSKHSVAGTSNVSGDSADNHRPDSKQNRKPMNLLKCVLPGVIGGNPELVRRNSLGKGSKLPSLTVAFAELANDSANQPLSSRSKTSLNSETKKSSRGRGIGSRDRASDDGAYSSRSHDGGGDTSRSLRSPSRKDPLDTGMGSNSPRRTAEQLARKSAKKAQAAAELLGISRKEKKRMTQEERKAKEDLSNLFEESKAAFQHQHASALWHFFQKPVRPKLTSTVGKTLGVPNLGPYGVMPIRTHIKAYSDSMDHSLYLRLVSADDPPGTAPMPLLHVIDQKKKERQRIIESRNNERYRTHKKVLLNNKHNRKTKQHDRPRIPQSFWDSWKKQTVVKYPHGIDLASGVKHKGHVDHGATIISSIFHLNNPSVEDKSIASSEPEPSAALKSTKSTVILSADESQQRSAVIPSTSKKAK